MSTYRPILAAIVPQTNTQTDKHILRNCSSANYTIESYNSVRNTAASRTAAYISLQLHGMTHEDIQAETTEAEFCEIQDSGSSQPPSSTCKYYKLIEIMQCV